MSFYKKLILGLFAPVLLVSLLLAPTQAAYADFADDFYDVRYEVASATGDDVSRASDIAQDDVFEFSEGDQILRIVVYNPDSGSDNPADTYYFYPLAESEEGVVRFVLGSSGLGGGIENMDVNLSDPSQLTYRGDHLSDSSRYEDSCNTDEGCGVNITATSGARQFLVDNYGADPDSIDVDDRDPDEIAADIAGSEEPAEVEEDNSCETHSHILGWIMCPVAGLLDSLTGFLDSQIERLLTVDKDFFRGDSEDGLRGVWTQFRNIAYIILIPIMLVMVIGTAIGVEAFSAYTVRKALPRMVIAIIFISLSWYICVFLVDLFNVLGTGIRGLVTAPFREAITETAPRAINSPQGSLKGALTAAGIVNQGSSTGEFFLSGASLGLMGAVGLFAASGAGVVSAGIIMSTLFSASLVLGAIFLLLIARQMIILALLLVAPLAILAWIFPGNDKLWKLWWGGFSKLLMLFPLIMLLIGVGQVFAYVAGIASGGADDGSWAEKLVTTVVIIAAYIVPYLFIPFAFKWAGGVFGNLAGMVNNAEKGILDRGKKKRAAEREKLKERSGNNLRYNPQGLLNRVTRGRANQWSSWAASPVANARVAMKTSTGKGIVGEINKKQLEQTSKMAQQFSQLGFNDRAGWAMAGFQGRSVRNYLAEEARSRGITDDVGIEKFIQDNGMRAVKNEADLDHNIELLNRGDGNDRLAAGQLSSAAVRGIIATSWSDPETQKANFASAGLLSSASQGFVERDQIKSLANSLVSESPDNAGFASQMVSTISLAGYRGGRLDMKPGYGVVSDSTGKFSDALGPSELGSATISEVEQQQKLVKTLKPHDIVGAKPASLEAMQQGILALAQGKIYKDGKLVDTSQLSAEQLEQNERERQAMVSTIISGASQFGGGDVKTKATWNAIVAQDASLQQALADYDMRYSRQRPQGGPPTPGAPSAGPPGGDE